MRVELRAERAQLGLGRELRDLLLADLARVALAGEANRVDATRGQHRQRRQHGGVVREQPPAAREPADFDHVMRRLRCRQPQRRRPALVQLDEAGDRRRLSRRVFLVPAHD